MAESGFTIFETAIGPCGIAWGENGLLATQLPGYGERDTRSWLTRRRPDLVEATLPPPDVQDAIERIAAHLRGEESELSAIALDMDGLPALNRRVYEIARTIPSGSTRTY
ncbi:MAG: cysteine methyltransferase, partial [Pseudomonadota bacterium]